MRIHNVFEVRYDAWRWFVKADSFSEAIEKWLKRVAAEDGDDAPEHPDEVIMHRDAGVIA